jgi:protein SCO1/2
MSVRTSEAGLKNASTDPQSKRRYFVLSLITLIAAVFVSILWHNETRRPPDFFGHPISPAKHAYDFHLTDQEGTETRLSHWRGKIVLFSFGFTHCPNVCPTILTNLADVFRALPPAERDRVRIAFISVDPHRDAPAQLKNYLCFFDPAFVGLTGAKDEIDRATGAFGASYAFIHKPDDLPENYNVIHSANVYLVNPKGEWELIYDFQQLQEPAKVAADIENILRR